MTGSPRRLEVVSVRNDMRAYDLSARTRRTICSRCQLLRASTDRVLVLGIRWTGFVFIKRRPVPGKGGAGNGEHAGDGWGDGTEIIASREDEKWDDEDDENWGQLLENWD